MKLKSTVKAGFTLVEIMIVVAIIGLLAVIAIPNFVRARTTAQKNACINNLRQIDGAIQQWALETKQAGDVPVTAENLDKIAEDYLKNEVKCPAAGTTSAKTSDSYATTTADVPPTCQIIPTGENAHTLLSVAPSGGGTGGP